MAVYRFRVTFEDDNEVYRDIDIKSSQSFYDFHCAILLSIGFEDNCDSSFFISDDMWRRGDEIALNPPQENDNSKKKKTDPPKYLMKKCKMAALIDDPHQKFIYVHDPEKTWVFSVELMKIVPDDAKVNYPKCTKSIGVAPKKVKAPIVLPDIDESEDDELIEHDDEAYSHASHGIDEDDLDASNLEEEESEEETSEDEMEEDEFDPEFGDGAESSFDED